MFSVYKNILFIFNLNSLLVCAKYASLAYEEMDSPTMLAHSSPIKVFKCGQGNAGLIIGGKVTENHEFPHMVPNS